MGKNKNTSLSWDAFQSLGNPDNSDVNDEKEQEVPRQKGVRPDAKVRVYIEKKGRGGKIVTLIKGTERNSDDLKDLCKTLKASCGVGGKVEQNDIMIQGDQRKKVIDKLLAIGYRDVKNAGA